MPSSEFTTRFRELYVPSVKFELDTLELETRQGKRKHVHICAPSQEHVKVNTNDYCMEG